MARTSNLIGSIVVVLCLAARAAPAEGAITCAGVLTTLSPCLEYVRNGGSLPVGCCDALRKLNAATQATPDLQAACGCVKSLVPALGGNPGLINGLPAKCQIPFPYKYSPSLDCSTLHR